MSSEEGRDGLMEQEERASGSVSYKVYLYYLKNVGWGLVSFIFAAMLMSSALNIGKSFWLSAWSEAGLSSEVGGANSFLFHELCEPCMDWTDGEGEREAEE